MCVCFDQVHVVYVINGRSPIYILTWFTHAYLYQDAHSTWYMCNQSNSYLICNPTSPLIRPQCWNQTLFYYVTSGFATYSMVEMESSHGKEKNIFRYQDSNLNPGSDLGLIDALLTHLSWYPGDCSIHTYKTGD